METVILENLTKAVREYDADAAAKWAGAGVEAGIDPIRAVDALTSAIREIGDGFGRGELWLPELVGAANAMKSAMTPLEAELVKRDIQRETLGTIVVGAVYGDIHDIGKTMVVTMLAAAGFKVHDLGVNVSAEQFIAAIKEHQAHAVALSALLTTTAPEQRRVIEALRQEGIRDKVKVMVGGGAITQAFADSIGADGYDPTAPGAAKLAKRLLGM